MKDKKYRVKEIEEKFNWFKNKMESSDDTGELDYIWHRDIKTNMHNVSKLYSLNGNYTKSEFDNDFTKMKKDLKSFYSRHRQNLVDQNRLGLKCINKILIDSLYESNNVRVLDAIWHRTVKIEIEGLEERYKNKKNLEKVKSMKIDLTSLYKQRRKAIIHDEKMKIEAKKNPRTSKPSRPTIYEAMKEGFYDEFMGNY